MGLGLSRNDIANLTRKERGQLYRSERDLTNTDWTPKEHELSDVASANGKAQRKARSARRELDYQIGVCVREEGIPVIRVAELVGVSRESIYQALRRAASEGKPHAA